MTRNEKRRLIKAYKKELERLGRDIDYAQKKCPKEFKLFEKMDDLFREGKYPDKKVQALYNLISDKVNRSFALCDLIEGLQPNKDYKEI